MLLVHPLVNEISEFGVFVLVGEMATMFEDTQSATFDACVLLPAGVKVVVASVAFKWRQDVWLAPLFPD